MVGMVAPGQGRIKRRLVAMPPSVRGIDPYSAIGVAIQQHRGLSSVRMIH